MKTWVVATFLTFLAASQAKDDYLQYDSVAIKRFEDELRRLGVSPPAVTVPEEPIKRPVPKVSSPAGVFEGRWIKSQFGRPIASFEGIPYAKSPVGPLRFKLAQPLPKFSKPFKASKLGSACMQRNGTGTNTIGQENCLFINIYVPEKVDRPKNENLPVVFFIHGGGLYTGQGSLKPGMLLEKDVVLVTFNYRLGPLGFLTTEDNVIPANIGLKDQVAALKWTAKNIASFGGNPNLITVGGTSAGAASVEFLMLSPLTKGHIHRVFSRSGSAYCPWALAPPGQMRQNVGKAAKLLSCPAEPSSALHACLQNKTGEEITQVNQKLAAWKQNLVVPFKVVVEGNIPGALLPEHPARLFANRSNDVPVLTGTVSEEGSIFGMFNIFKKPAERSRFDKNFLSLAPPLLNLAGPRETNRTTVETLRRAYIGPGPFNSTKALLATKLFGDVNFVLPAIKSVQSHLKGSKSPVYFYHFNYRATRSLKVGKPFDTSKDYGVFHGKDRVYFSPFTQKARPMDIKMAMIYSDLFVNFARNGVPSTNLVNVTWTPVSSVGKDMEYLYIYTPLDIQLKKNLFPERWTLLKALFEGTSA